MNMLGVPTVYDKVPYFFSDQYDLGMEYRGWAPSWDEVVFQGDPATRQFIAFWLLRRRVVAAMSANTWDAGDALEALIRARLPVDRARLIDPGVDLASLAVPSAS
jgi:3-phenylpropionate/trans-cinnamate dioxygenase ferredoxin reductase subunit